MMVENEVAVADDFEAPQSGETLEGSMSVAVKTERGFTLTRDYGFTVEEENGKVISFDLLNHPDLGITLLFGQQVFALKFWDEEDLDRAENILKEAVAKEKERRNNGA